MITTNLAGADAPWYLRRALALALASLCALAAASEGASPPPAPEQPLSAEEIVARNAQARGGLEAWHAVQTLAEKGRIEHGQIKGPRRRHGTPTGAHGGSVDQAVPFSLELKRPHKMRVEMTLGDTTALQLFDGKRGWTVQPSPQGPLVHEFTAAEAAASAGQLDPEGPLIDAAAKGTAVALEGTESVEGRRAYKLALTLKDGERRHLWIDAQTFLDLKIDGDRIIDGRTWQAQTYFYDWKATGGVRVPFRIETAVGDVRTSTRIVVDKALANVPLADERFTLPESARRPAASSPSATPAPASPAPAQ